MAKILLVEDDNNLREIYGARLTAEGYEIVAAPDGEEALAIAVKEKPDLIITDVMMPKISGFDMLDILRNAPETKDTKVIMMTALSQAEDKERADKLGADLYLVKSQVTLEDVAASVRKVLEPGNSSSLDTEEAAEPVPAEPPAEMPTPEATPAPVAEPPKLPDTPPADSTPPVEEGTKEAVTPPAPSTPALPSTPAPDPVPAPSPTPTPAPVIASTSPTPPVEEGTKEAVTPSAPSTPALPSTPAPDPVPAPSPTPTPAPAPVPAPEPPAPAPEPEPPKPVAKKIEVILPDSKEEPVKEPSAKAPEEVKPAEDKPVESAATPTDAPASPAVPTIDDGGLSIGPNLAEALAEEEKTLPEQASVAAKGEKPAVVASNPEESGPSAVIKPQITTALDGPSAEKPTPGPTLAAPITGTSAKKIIEPINDLTSSPDLNALLAEEEAKEQGLPSISPPATTPPETPENQTEHPDDFSKISL